MNRSPIEMLYHWERECPDRVYLRQPVDGRWEEWTWGDLAGRVRRLASFIRRQEFEAGTRIAIYGQNCSDWFAVDLAIMLCGHISVPLYPGQAPEMMRYILSHSDARMIFVGAEARPVDLGGLLPENVRRVGMFGCKNAVDDQLEQVLAQEQPCPDSPRPDPDSIMTIMYTSGTTGNPKGVVHTFRAPGFVLPNLIEAFRADSEDRFVSYLPLAHAAERVAIEMQSLYCGGSVSFTESLETFVDDLKSIRPTIFFSVPRLWTKFKESVESRLPPEQRTVLQELPVAPAPLRQLVLDQLGLSHVRHFLTGSAPTPPDVRDWYARLGIQLLDGYGMTENFIYGCIFVDRPVQGSVGKTMRGSELKISGKGEVLFRSQAVMKGYYLEPEKTAETLKEGFLHTGDTGYTDEQGNLFLTGRLSETFKTLKGKFVSPSTLENRLSSVSTLEQVCVMGHGMHEPVLLATLSAVGKGMERGELEDDLAAELDRINGGLEPHERIKTVFVCRDEWTIEQQLITPTLKIRRRAIEQKYRPMLEACKPDATVVWE